MSTEKANIGATYSPETLEAAGFPTISHDVLQDGMKFRSGDHVLRPADVEAYAYAVEDYDPLFFDPGPYGAPIAHPTIFANQALAMRHNHYFVPAGLHARMIYNFRAPIRLGMRVRAQGRMSEKYVRRGKPYMVTEYKSVTEDGAVLVDGRFVQMLFAQDKAPASGSSAPDEPEPPQFDAAIAEATGRSGPITVGQTLSPLTRTISQRQIDIYSGVTPLSIHTDPDWARAKGFPNTIAQGMMSTAYASTIMTTAFGPGFIEGGTLDAKFIRPVICGDTLTITGAVAGFTTDANGKSRAHVSLQAQNQDGHPTMAATATAVCG